MCKLVTIIEVEEEVGGGPIVIIVIAGSAAQDDRGRRQAAVGEAGVDTWEASIRGEEGIQVSMRSHTSLCLSRIGLPSFLPPCARRASSRHKSCACDTARARERGPTARGDASQPTSHPCTCTRIAEAPPAPRRICPSARGSSGSANSGPQPHHRLAEHHVNGGGITACSCCSKRSAKHGGME